MDTLDLVWKIRVGHAFTNQSFQTQRYWLDFIVSDSSLRERLIENTEDDRIGCLGWGLKANQIDTINQLLLIAKPEMESGRYLLYVCPECGDIGCGAISAEIVQDEETVCWKGFGYENGYEGINFGSYQGLELRFNKVSYQKLFLEYKRCLLEDNEFNSRRFVEDIPHS